MQDLISILRSVGLLPLALWMSGTAGIYLAFLPIDRDFPGPAKAYIARTIFSPVKRIDVAELCRRYIEFLKIALRSRTFGIFRVSFLIASPLRTVLATLSAYIFTIYLVVLLDQKHIVEIFQFVYQSNTDQLNWISAMITNLTIAVLVAFLANFVIDFFSYTKTVNILNTFETFTLRTAVGLLLIDLLATIAIVWIIMAIFNIAMIVIMNAFMLDQLVIPLRGNLALAIVEGPFSGLKDFLHWCGSVLYGGSLFDDVSLTHEDPEITLTFISVILVKYINIIVYLTSFWVLFAYCILVLLSVFIAAVNRYSTIHMFFINHLEPEDRPFRAIGIVCSTAWLLIFWPLYILLL